MLTRRVNLWDTGAVDLLIKKTEWSGKRRNNVSYAYKDWCNWKGFDYEFKYYREDDPPLPYISTEKEIDQLIAGVPSKYASFLQLLKESAFRPSEAGSLTPNDVNLDRRVITLNKPSKRSKPRQFRMSDKLTSMIATRIHDIPANQRIWTSRTQDMSRTFMRARTQEHDLASRRFEIIDRHIDWIHNKLGGKPSKILDLACGPGLYSNRLTKLGHSCRGIDFGPASIKYAREQAIKEEVEIDYVLEDIRTAARAQD